MSLAMNKSCRRQVCRFGCSAASRFCRAFDEARGHVRTRQTMDEVVPLAELATLLAA